MVFLFVFVTIIILFIFSKINMEIHNFKFSSQADMHIQEDYEFIIKLCILGSIPIFKLTITNVKIEKWKIKEKIKYLDKKWGKEEKIFFKNIIEALKKVNIQIKEINLSIEIGTENAGLTSIIVPLISTAMAILLRKKLTDLNKQEIIIQPIFINKNLINIEISGIFGIKVMHIINMIYILIKKGRVNKHERTSNRRSYDYSYE